MVIANGELSPEQKQKLYDFLIGNKLQKLGDPISNNQEKKSSDEPISPTISLTPPNAKPETRTTAAGSPIKGLVKPEETYSGAINPNKKYGMPVYNANAADGYTIDYTAPESETASNESNESTQGNNAETVGNVSDGDNKVVGNFLNKNIFGGLSEAANPGESLS